MSKNKKYIFNPKTLSYEVDRRSRRSRIFKSLVVFAISLGLAVFYGWIYTAVLGLEFPKTILLKKENALWCSKVEVMNSRLDKYDEVLTSLQMRDDDIYRSIFGMNDIPKEVRNAGFGGVNRYEHLEQNPLLKNTVMRLDMLTKKTYVQSKSFDEVYLLSKRAGDMASCIPAIPPVTTDRKVTRLSSSFGQRSDPFTGEKKRHTGVDFALKPGNLVYATGDGVVEKIKFELFGYGNWVMIDHGFGYKTRYAHMKSISVVEGMPVKRGQCIGESGNSGRSTGPHLHYEVMYRDSYINPINYFDFNLTPQEYATMVDQVEAATPNITIHPSHRKKK